MRAFSRILYVTVCLLFGTALQAAPANDWFSARHLLIGTNITVSGSNGGATLQLGEPTSADNVSWLYSVWYSWTSPTNGVVYFSGTTPISDFYISIRAYRGLTVTNLVPAPTTLDGGVPVGAGDTIAIQVASLHYGAGYGPFTLRLVLELPAPASGNDAFEDRLEMTHPRYQFAGSIYAATTEAGEPVPADTSQTLWWKFRAPEKGLLAVLVDAPQFAPVMTLYEGADLSGLSPVDELAQRRYQLEPGREYALQMATPHLPGGRFTLQTYFLTGTNDFFAGSVHLEGTNVAFIGRLSSATFESGEPDPGATNSVWFSWVAPFTGRARYVGTAPPLYVTLYTGPTVDRLQPVRDGEDSNRGDFLAVEGTVYHFQLAGRSDECWVTLQLFPWQPAPNDFFNAAHPLAGNHVNAVGIQEWFAISDATSELGEPAHLGATPAKSLWFRWTAPVSGLTHFRAERSVAPNVVLAIYEGTSVETLRLVTKGIEFVEFTARGGSTYNIAAAVPTNVLGDVLLYGFIMVPSASSQIIPGNLLREPSWEGTAIHDAQYWRTSGSVGGSVNEPGGADGTTWPHLGSGTKIWQDFSTVAGQNHSIRFAFLGHRNDEAHVRVWWDDQQIGLAHIPYGEGGFWHWAEFPATARSTTSRVTFENIGPWVELDAFSVVSLTAPPEIITQPSSTTVMAGGTAAFAVGVSGSPPLTYTWYFKGSPLPGAADNVLILESARTNDAGAYQVIVSNPFGAVTSAPVSLVVHAPSEPVVLWHPYGDVLTAGGYHSLSVVAAGEPPLFYQWHKDGQAIAGATNRSLVFDSIALADAGVYSVRVGNAAGGVWSLNATLVVTNGVQGGSTILFGNKLFVPTMHDVPVFDIDEVTPLSGSNFMAQLYAGPAFESLRPAGRPSHFLSGVDAGLFYPQVVTLPGIPPGSNAVVQVRAWDATRGNNYEEARAVGGRFGRSTLLTIRLHEDPFSWVMLDGLTSFSLDTGLPQFATGEITFIERQPGNVVVWSHRGEPGFRYLIEKSNRDFEWRPFQVVTNVTLTVTFTDSASSGANAVFYRSRILD